MFIQTPTFKGYFFKIILTGREKTARNTAILTTIVFEYIMHVHYCSSWNNDASITNVIFANICQLSSTEHFPANKLKASFLSYLYRVSTKFLSSIECEIIRYNTKKSKK